MSKKKLEVIELNKKEEKIVLEEEQSRWILFWKKYNKLFLSLFLIISLTVVAVSVLITISNLQTSDKMIIKEVSIDTNLDITSADVTADPSVPLTDETAKDIFKKSTIFKSKGEVLLVKTVSKKEYTIKFYSDYTAIKTSNYSNIITRINSIDGESYGIKENGVINSKAETSDITKTEIQKYAWGTVTYHSDGSAEITNSQMDMYVRDAEDIEEKYISNNKVTYLKEDKNNNGIKLNYYHDGTIEVNKKNKRYLVRSEKDLDITTKDVKFKNNNQSVIIKTKKLSNGKTIYYYSDGGAIIKDGNNKLSVRKSNSIIIKNDRIYEIVDNIYVTISDTKNNGNIIYYTNGSAVIKNYNGKTIYVHENSDIKFDGNKIISIGNNYEVLTEDRKFDKEQISTFETIAVVKTNDYIAIVPKDSVLYDTDGTLKAIVDIGSDLNDKPITITNNTNDVVKYRLVIEKSNRTTLDVQYLRYQLSIGGKYVEPTRLDSKIWQKDEISESLSVTGINYILVEKTLEPQETNEIKLMLWTDYETIPNSMQNKYFYGTIRIYAWQEIELNI